MWGVGLILLSVFGIFLMSLFGSITVTNQQDYTAMKNTVEAAMYDAIDIGLYRTGFCICSNTQKNTDGKWIFTDSSQYKILSLNDDSCNYDEYSDCERIDGEYVIDKKVFAESLVRRFAESVKSSYDYQIIIEDVVEYPPKVSVNVKSSNKYDPSTGDEEYSIDNKIDAIIEMDSAIDVHTVDDKCLIDDITCDSKGKCKDSHGNLCFEREEYTPEEKKQKCQKNVTCRQKGNVYECRDPDGNLCGSGYIQIPTIPTGNPNKMQKANEIEKKIIRRGCFLKGTKIVTENGYKDINEIKVGDYVLTYNEKKKVNEYKRVVHLFELKDLHEELYTIKTDDTELKLTALHNVYTKRDGKYLYLAAQDLKTGDIVRYSDGEYHEIIDIKYEPIEETVYNLEIEDNHNFYVGDKGILVHNAVSVGNGSNSSSLNKALAD